MKSGLLDSPGGDLGADLLDQQFAVQMSGLPGGLSELIAKQLSRQMGVPEGGVEPPKKADGPGANPSPSSAPISARTKASALAAYGNTAPPASTAQGSFVHKHSEAAARIEKTSGIPASYMLGQAGHETGWGRSEIRMKGGAPSHNLFGIKAGPGWNGKVAEVTTTEYVNGTARKTVAKFRAYDSYEDSFRDYARLINESPRYAQVSQNKGSPLAFATSLQRAGYATDPAYADKLSRAIASTQRLQRIQA